MPLSFTHFILLVSLELVRLCHEQHPPDEVGGGDALGALALAVPVRALHLLIRVRA